MISQAIEKGRVLRPFFYEKKEHFLNKVFKAEHLKL